jgi:di/tricarboxylate transporter
MEIDQLILLFLIAMAFAGFLWGKFRYDIVALTILICAVVVKIIPISDAFSGFGHPAVFMVAAVLIISRALISAGATDMIAVIIDSFTKSRLVHIFTLCVIAAFLSAFINNVGALAFLMPIAIQTCIKQGRSPGVVLMPLSFASILGGLVTSIGTPPNIIISKYRTELIGSAFEMFDFTPVGILVVLGGILFVTFIGWRLIPKEKREAKKTEELFDVDNYILEAKIPRKSKLLGLSLRDVDDMTAESEVSVVGFIRKDRKHPSVPRRIPLQVGDILILEGEQTELNKYVTSLKLELIDTKGKKIDLFTSPGATLIEVVVPAQSGLENKTIGSLRLQGKYRLNLLGVSRQGRPYRGRMKAFKIKAGDILLVHGLEEYLNEFINIFGCLPLAQRDLKFNKSGQAFAALGVFISSILVAVFGFMPLQISLVIAAGLMVLMHIVPPSKMYESIDWSIIVLIGAMIPIGEALEDTGTAAYLVQNIFRIDSGASPFLLLGGVLIVTMTVSDILNNAATAVLMAPIAYNISFQLGASPDPFLMAVAIGASCAFLTPIGHQNNAMIMGPGGYEFKDYWRMGLPLEIIVTAIAVPAIIYFWPIYP